MTAELSRITVASFSGLEDQAIEVLDPDTEVVAASLLITEIKPLAQSHPHRAEPFEIVATCDKSLALEQATYLLRHPAFGTEAIFIVPVAEDETQRHYQMIFN